jgi:hypothetical protein
MAGPDDDDDLLAKNDPALLAELASWFERPSIPMLEEQQRAAAEAGQESFEESEWRETRERRDKAAAAADPGLLARLWDRDTAPPPFEPRPPVSLTLDETIALALVRAELDRAVRTDPLAPERAFGVPPDIVALVSEDNAPQALLRDLYRPVTDYERRFESPFGDIELPDFEAAAKVRAALRETLAVEWLTPPMDTLDSIRVELHQILDLPWADQVEAAKAVREEGKRRTEEEIRVEMWGR